MPLIKRYPNRKLYDTEAKCYVTLEHIAEMIREGQDVEVIDHETGEDLTTLTLSQIILDQEKKQAGFLPRSLMTSLIRTGGDTVDFLLRSLHGAVPPGAALIEERLAKLVEAGKLTAEQARAVAQALQEDAREVSRVDENLAAVLHRLNIPTNRDIAELREKLTLLTEQLKALGEDDATE